MNIELNKLFEKNFLVEKQHSAKNMKSGDLEVLATPSLVAFMEEASKEYLNTFLEDGYGSVGINININHIAPTLIGKTILVKGCIKEIIREKIIIFSSILPCLYLLYNLKIYMKHDFFMLHIIIHLFRLLHFFQFSSYSIYFIDI
ncbi:thioesterase family protein [Gemella sp. oral taxon 928]|uniref:thioesterase family protein n=1 Tax=Gemella sp. oral taxon 928 TaxID=1785995 RepID=UPI0018D25A7F|nr:hotdog domain-containing protein [Gemella sp. oral taxon 928]